MNRNEFFKIAFEGATAAKKAGAPINVAIAVAQAMLETGYGKSKLFRDANNVFGVKAGKSWTGATVSYPTREFSADRGWYTTVATFRRYYDLAQAFRDYGEVIGRLSWYKDAAANCDDPAKFLLGIMPRKGEPGWATDPDYATKVWALARQWAMVPARSSAPKYP